MDGDVYHRPARHDPAGSDDDDEDEDDRGLHRDHDEEDDEDDDDDDHHHATNERVAQLEEQLALAAEFGMSLTQRCEEAEAHSAQLERDLQFVREEKQDVERDRTRARVELDDVAHHAEELQHQLGTSQQRVKSLRTDLDSAREEIEELRTTRRSRGHTSNVTSSASVGLGGGSHTTGHSSFPSSSSEPHGRPGGLDASPRGLSGRRRLSSSASLDGIDQDALDALVNQHTLEKGELEMQRREQAERAVQLAARLDTVLNERGTLQEETEKLRKQLKELTQSSDSRIEDLETTNSRLTLFVNETVLNVASVERKCAELEDLYAASNRRGDELQDQVQALSQQLAAPPASGGDGDGGSGAAAGAKPGPGGLATTPKGSSLANSTIIQSNRFFHMNLAPKAALSPSSKVLRDRKHKNKGVADLHDFFMLTGTAVRMNLMLHPDTVELVGRVSWTPEISRDWHDKALAAGVPFHEFQHWIADQFLLEASISEDRKSRIQAVQARQEEEENARRRARAQAMRETPTPEVRANGRSNGGGSSGSSVPGRVTRRPRVTPISPPDPQSPANANGNRGALSPVAAVGNGRHPQEQMLQVRPQVSATGGDASGGSGGLAHSASPLSRGVEPLGGLSAADLDAMVSPSFGRTQSPRSGTDSASSSASRRKKKKPKSRVATIASSVSSFFS